jgi:hypothetical protein
MEMSVPAETVIAVSSALIGSVAGALLAFRIEKRKDKLAEEKSRIQNCYENCRRLDDLLAEWYTAIYDAVTFKETAQETIAALEGSKPNQILSGACRGYSTRWRTNHLAKTSAGWRRHFETNV